MHKNKVPTDWIRKQTLTGSERYITEELKDYEQKILGGAEDQIQQIEQHLYQQLVTATAEFVAPVQLNASLLARLDCLISFATTAKKHNYIRPTLNDAMPLILKLVAIL